MVSTPDTGNTWKAALTELLRNSEEVEAILLSPKDRRISVATLGPVDLERLESRIRETLHKIDADLIFEKENLPPTADSPFIERRLRDDYLIEKPSCATAPRFWAWRDFSWPEPDDEPQTGEEWRSLATQAGICGIALASAFILPLLFSIPAPVVIALYAVSMIAGGYDAAIDATAKLRRRQLDIHFLMLAVAVGASAIGAYAEGALLLFLFSLSGALEHFAMYRTHREISSLVADAPENARRLRADGSTETVPVADIRIGEKLLVRPDERFPVDGIVRDGSTAADESNLTGEATPVTKGLGETVFGGTLNLWGIATIEATRPATESALQRIIHLIHEARHRRAPSQRFTDRFGTSYTSAVLAATFGVFLLWWLGLRAAPFVPPEGSFSAFYRAMTFLVVASPCALVLSIPSAILAAIASGARHGVLFRGGAAIEKLAEIDAVALDKTGTLTTGDLRVVSVESFPEGRETDVAELAFSLESHSNHPIARAITRYGEANALRQRPVSDFQQISGRGIRAVSETEVCFLGRRELIEAGELGQVLSTIGDPPQDFSEVWILHEGIIGRILLQDEIRTESAAVLRDLAARGIETLMLTGDRRGTAEAIGTELGISRVESGLLPEGKVAIIRELEAQGKKVAMVGDGVNDAPSLAAAYVSVAMGARGSDAALEQAEVVLMNDKIEKFLSALRLSLRARRIIRQNIAVALGTVAIMMVASILGLIPLTIGVIAHEGSTVVVCLNSLRLLISKS